MDLSRVISCRLILLVNLTIKAESGPTGTCGSGLSTVLVYRPGCIQLCSIHIPQIQETSPSLQWASEITQTQLTCLSARNHSNRYKSDGMSHSKSPSTVGVRGVVARKKRRP